MAVTSVKIHVVATMNFWFLEQCITWTLPIRKFVLEKISALLLYSKTNFMHLLWLKSVVWVLKLESEKVFSYVWYNLLYGQTLVCLNSITVIIHSYSAVPGKS